MGQVPGRTARRKRGLVTDSTDFTDENQKRRACEGEEET
jgi:hypothetical protein